VADDKQTLVEWWKEDADRHNELCRAIQNSGAGIKFDPGPPPALNPDGTMAQKAPPPKTTDPPTPTGNDSSDGPEDWTLL
jgi:hypothetical protein